MFSFAGEEIINEIAQLLVELSGLLLGVSFVEKAMPNKKSPKKDTPPESDLEQIGHLLQCCCNAHLLPEKVELTNEEDPESVYIFHSRVGLFLSEEKYPIGKNTSIRLGGKSDLKSISTVDLSKWEAVYEPVKSFWNRVRRMLWKRDKVVKNLCQLLTLYNRHMRFFDNAIIKDIEKRTNKTAIFDEELLKLGIEKYLHRHQKMKITIAMVVGGSVVLAARYIVVFFLQQ